MKNSADLGGCYPPRPSASVDNTLLDLQNSSYPTQPHSIIAKYPTNQFNFLETHVYKLIYQGSSSDVWDKTASVTLLVIGSYHILTSSVMIYYWSWTDARHGIAPLLDCSMPYWPYLAFVGSYLLVFSLFALTVFLQILKPWPNGQTGSPSWFNQ